MRSVRINKTCLLEGHDWDWFGGPPNWVCSRPGCHVRADMYGGTDADIMNGYVPISVWS